MFRVHKLIPAIEVLEKMAAGERPGRTQAFAGVLALDTVTTHASWHGELGRDLAEAVRCLHCLANGERLALDVADQARAAALARMLRDLAEH